MSRYLELRKINDTLTGGISVTPVVPATGLTTDLLSIGGTAVSVNNGTSDAGCQRVNIANDNDTINIKTDGTNHLLSNLAQVSGTATSVGAGNSDAGTQRVVVASDQANVGVNITQVNGSAVDNNNGAFETDTVRIAGTLTTVNTGNAGAGTQRVVLATDQPTVNTEDQELKDCITTDGGAQPAKCLVIAGLNAATNAQCLSVDGNGELRCRLSTINGVPISSSNGVAGAGVQRVAIASDNSSIDVSLQLQGVDVSTSDPVPVQLPALPTYYSVALKDGALFDVNLDYTGGGVGTKDYKFTSVANGTTVKAMCVSIQDNAALSATTYGSLARLTTGILMFRKPSGGGKVYYNTDIPVRDNQEWSLFADQHQVFTYGLGATDAVRAGVTFPYDIVLDTGDEFGIEVADDLSGLVRHYFQIHYAEP